MKRIDYKKIAFSEGFLLLCLSLIFFFIPFLFWGHTYKVGGDDSGLYYLFPKEYFQNFTLTLVRDNELGTLGNYYSQSYISGFVLFVSFIKTLLPYVNTQSLFFGLNLSLGFFFFYKLLDALVIKTKDKVSFFVKLLASMAYIFSGFSIYTIWSTRLFALYLISIFPLISFLFIRALEKRSFVYLFPIAIILSVFSFILLALPWFLGLIIAIIPLFYFLILLYGKRVLSYLGCLLGLVISFNLYWIVHFIYAPFSGKVVVNDISSTVSSVAFRDANTGLIRAVSGHNSILYPLLNTFHRSIVEGFNWEVGPIYHSGLRFIILWSLSLLIIFSPIYFFKNISQRLRRLYIVALASWAFTLFLFTVKIDDWGIPLFLWLNNHVPGFVMFRNMFDKFALALSFSTAILLGVSLIVLVEAIQKNKVKKLLNPLLLIILLIILIQARPLIQGKIFHLPLWTTSTIHKDITDFNPDFYQLVTSVKKNKDLSRFLWLPLNNFNYIAIQDVNENNHYYIGVSPLKFLANQVDYTGNLSFTDKQASIITDSLKRGDYEAVGKLFQKMNVQYLIVNKNIPQQISQSYLYSPDLLAAQSPEFYKAILGNKIQDFGDRYSIYAINKSYSSSTFYITPDPNSFTDNQVIQFKEISQYRYRLDISHLKSPKDLVYLDVYNQQWRLQIAGEDVDEKSHHVALDYANSWHLDPEVIKKNYPTSYTTNSDGSINLSVDVYFWPVYLRMYALIFSAGSFVLTSLVVVVWAFGRRKRNKVNSYV